MLKIKVYKNGNTLLKYYKDDKLHRQNSPAVILVDKHNYILKKVYYWKGKIHKKTGPAWIENWAKSYTRKVEKYYRHGLLHRDQDGFHDYECEYSDVEDYLDKEDIDVRLKPVIIQYGLNRKISTIQYYEYGKLIDGRSILNYYSNGNIHTEIYYKSGKLHREDGPAYLIYDNNGNVTNKLYFINQKRIDNAIVERNPEVLTDKHLRRILC